MKWVKRIFIALSIMIAMIMAGGFYLEGKPPEVRKEILMSSIKTLSETGNIGSEKVEYSYLDILFNGVLLIVALGFLIIVLRTLRDRLNIKGE